MTRKPLAILIDNENIPAHPSPLKVGDCVLVTGLLYLTNSRGGTEMLRDANIPCTVTKAFWDYETGWIYHGTPTETSDVERLRALGTSEFGPDWQRKNHPNDAAGLAHAVKALAEFDPTKVVFWEHDIKKNGDRL